MESNGNQRKRGGRMAKNANTTQKIPQNEIIENSAVAISPTLEEQDSKICAPASECRRSSRKKIIKFDVRDLLNKNRKTHKIQIEARIDSNAPSTSKGATGDASVATKLSSSSASREDLLSKHKTFLEKSAIFRRYSISQEQKPPPPLPIPPLLSKSNENKDSAFCGTSSSQEFLSKALIKPKQPTSLIVAQIESNKPAFVSISKRKGPEMKSIIVSNSDISPVVRQKKRGRPAKIKAQTPESKATSNISPEKAKNWKEYKACLAQQSSGSNEEENISKVKVQSIVTLPQQRNQTHMLIKKQDSVNDFLQSDISRSDDDGSFSGFQISKDDISCESPILGKKSLEEKNIDNVPCEDIKLEGEVQNIENAKTFKTSLNKNKINDAPFSEEREDQQVETSNIKNSNLYISNASIFDTDKLKKIGEDTEHKADNQEKKMETCIIENFVNVAAIERREYDCRTSEYKQIASKHIASNKIVSDECSNEEKAPNITSKTDIVSTEENISKNVQTIVNKESETGKCLEQTIFETDDLCTEPKCNLTITYGETLTALTTETGEKLNSGVAKKFAEGNKKHTEVEKDLSFAIMDEMDSSESSIPSYQNKLFSCTSSSSESENTSDRSVYLSDPLSTTSTSSSRSYKSGDIVKVSIKRISLPKSPSTSSQTSTSEELHNIDKSKSTVVKRSKRLKKKLNDSLNADNTSNDNDDCLQRISMDAKNSELDVEKRIRFVPQKSSTAKNQSKNNIKPSNDYLEICEESTKTKDICLFDETGIKSEINSRETNVPLNEVILTVLEKDINKKSPRTRMDCYLKKDEAESNEAKKSLANEIGDELNPLGKVFEKEQNKDENSQNISINDEKKFLFEKDTVNDQNDKSKDNKQEKTFRKSQTLSQPEKQDIICTEEKSKILIIEDDTKTREQNITHDEGNKSDKKKYSVELHKEDDINMINKTDIIVDQAKAEITKSEKCSQDETADPLEGKQQGFESNFKKDENVNDLTVQTSSEYEACKEENTDSKSFVLDSQNNSKSPDNLTEVVSENRITVTSGKAETIESELENPEKTVTSECMSPKYELDNKEKIYLTASTSSRRNTEGNDDMFEFMQGKTKSPIQNVTSAEVVQDDDYKISVDDPIEGKKGDVLLEDLKFQQRKETAVEPIEISPGTLIDQNKKLSAEIKINPTKTLDKKAEKDCSEISTSDSITQKENTDEKNQIEEQCLISEITNSQNSESALVEAEMKLIENATRKMKRDRKVTEQIQREKSPIHSASQQEIKQQQETSLKNYVYEEANLSETSLKDNGKTKGDTLAEIQMATSEVKESEILIDELQTDKNTRSKTMTASKPGLRNVTYSLKTKQNQQAQTKISTVSPKVTTPKKALKSLNETSSTDDFSSEEKLEETKTSLISLKIAVEHSIAELPQTSRDNLISVMQRRSTSLDTNKQLCVPESTATKRRGRKPRFKNLYGIEDSETDNSNGKITPIDEVLQQNLKALEDNRVVIEGSEEFSEIEFKKTQGCVNAVEDTAGAQEDAATNLSTSQIKNVSIETNTLLDILRTVQSNTAAALMASKTPTNMKNADEEQTVNSTSNAQIDESSKNSQDSTIIQQQETTSIIFDVASGSTTKKLNLSPERSNSSSPLTLKRVTISPIRSNSVSPLTLKKVTRRYERRSRRGEDSAHKTLEETFAEIAAQSSKAVLAAKEFEEKSSEELDSCITSVITEKVAIKEKWEDFGNPSEMNLDVDRDKKVGEILLDVVPDVDKESTVFNKLNDDSRENIVSVETTKTTPTRRGRKPKNRPPDLPTVTQEELIISECIEERSESKDKDLRMDAEEKSLEGYDANKNDNDLLESSLIENLPDCKEKTISVMTTHSTETELPALTLNLIDNMGENKSTEEVNNKHEAKNSPEEDNSLVVAVACQEKSDEIRIPKQHIKKRDSSLNKNETKAAAKKTQKKTKNEEEDSLNSLTEDNSIKNTATTPPLSKRGRKPKGQQLNAPHSGSKKKTKRDSCAPNDGYDTTEEKVKLFENECESSLDKLLDEKLAKKTRQRKLKEAFEAALTDNKKESIETSNTGIKISSNFDLKFFSNSPPADRRESFSKEDQSETVMPACVTPVESEEDPDPLKDIEKFIADGVNLLKKDYKLDENSVHDMQTMSIEATKIVEDSLKTANNDVKLIFNTFETPADTPINTPSVTPPPKSPSSFEPTTPDENSGVRRSHRIKLITKTPKALVGRGLVRDRERFSIKDDVETKSHYTLDDHLTDLAEVEAKNAKFLKEMEERLSNFQVIKENEYLCERVISREAKKMICDCFLTHEEEYRGELGCGEDCLNRLLMIECGSECNVKERCTNKRFQKLLCSPCRVFRTEKKGFGIMADIEILPGEFILEYVGEVINTEEFEKRRVMYSQEKNRHYYFMALRSDAIIDATIKGNISRFINHSCDPNAETQKWTVNGELRIGFFSRKSIMPGEEITFNYQYQRYGREAQRCYCESTNCTGWIGQEPTSDEGEQIDDEDDETEDEEEEAVTTNLLVQDDEDDSDASVADPEEVQKRLEMAAAQAEAELAPLQLMQEKGKHVQPTLDESKTLQDLNKSDNEEDSKSKFKKLLSKMAAKQKQSKREQKLQRKKKSKESSSELTKKLRFLEDPDIEDEVQFLKECGLKNQSDTLRLSRLMVRAKLVQTRLNLLEVLRKGDFPCRRLFLDYHGLRLLHGWMSEDAGNMQIRLSLLQTLQTLPIANKTVLTDSKVMQVVRTWSGPNNNLSPNEDSSSSNSNSQDAPVQGSTTFEESSEIAELQKLALQLIAAWEGLPEIFRIPKKERIEQMKEHEREADRQYAANAEIQENTTASNRYRRDRFGRGLYTSNNSASTSNRFTKPNSGNPHKTVSATPENLKNLSKAQRRELFAAKVARDEAEKRLAEERREFETKCRFFGLDPKKTRSQDMPFCVNPDTGQWFSIERKPIITPPSYAHVQVPVKTKSTDPNDYQLPAVCSTLPSHWKYAITPQGKIYFYHIKHRQPQWEPPSLAQLKQYELEVKEEESESEITSTAGEDSSDDDDDILIGMDAAQLKAYINRKVEMRRQKRYQRLVDERSISPRREEDRIYNQIEVRKYKENKEKIRKRKEDIRRKRAEALRQTSVNLCTLGSITDTIPSTSKLSTESDEEAKVLPIQDYLLSSDEETDIKAEVNSPLIDKIVEGDKIVDELDALTTKRQLKRPLPPHRDLGETPTSSSTPALIATVSAAKLEYKKRKLEKKDKKKPKEQDAKYRKNKEKFRCEIAGIIVHHLKPYLKDTCVLGRIQSNEDFNHLARKLTHFVMIKELKYCESVGQTLVVTESVKSKSREFIKKYMAKYGDVYVKPTNDPDFKDIPFTL